MTALHQDDGASGSAPRSAISRAPNLVEYHRASVSPLPTRGHVASPADVRQPASAVIAGAREHLDVVMQLSRVDFTEPVGRDREKWRLNLVIDRNYDRVAIKPRA